jgi:catechol 2,3-dioxygenase-like lactoylglutathione lyase family enzyme
MPVTQFLTVSITVADLARTAAFYGDRLGLEIGPERTREDPGWITLLGLEQGTTARAVDVTIGQQTLDLVAFDPPGRLYSPERASNDQWFQHVALVSGDIAAAWKRLEGRGKGTITEGPPVLLPANTGGVTAYKFRDPEGHPLEWISFPPKVGDPQWQRKGRSLIMGYDHTAIVAMDVERSIAFYAGLLGFKIGGRSLNIGIEQDHLDGLTDCEVDVVALQPARRATPHVELLHYRMPAGRTSNFRIRANDVASVRQVHRVDDLGELVRRLEASGVTFASPGLVRLKGGEKATTILDPDGHMITLMSER